MRESPLGQLSADCPGRDGTMSGQRTRYREEERLAPRRAPAGRRLVANRSTMTCCRHYEVAPGWSSTAVSRPAVAAREWTPGDPETYPRLAAPRRQAPSTGREPDPLRPRSARRRR